MRLFLPALITVSIMGSCLALMHNGIGTPRIAPTIAPALTVAFLFCLYTTFKMAIEPLLWTQGYILLVALIVVAVGSVVTVWKRARAAYLYLERGSHG